jgi:hypothetical protein
MTNKREIALVSFLRQLLCRRNTSAPEEKSKIVISPFARTTESKDGIVWLQLEEGLVFRANSIGARIWRGLVEEREPDAIAEDISREYGAKRETVSADVVDFLEELAARRLIQMDRKAA